MLAVIRIRGSVGMKKDIKDTLVMLRLQRKNHCIVLNETAPIRGMLQKSKDYITWGEISDDILKALIKKRGRKSGDIKLKEEETEKIFSELKAGKKIKDLKIKPVFRLTPPSGGFRKSIKQHYPNGEIGYRKDKINELLLKMI